MALLFRHDGPSNCLIHHQVWQDSSPFFGEKTTLVHRLHILVARHLPTGFSRPSSSAATRGAGSCPVHPRAKEYSAGTDREHARGAFRAAHHVLEAVASRRRESQCRRSSGSDSCSGSAKTSLSMDEVERMPITMHAPRRRVGVVLPPRAEPRNLRVASPTSAQPRLLRAQARRLSASEVGASTLENDSWRPTEGVVVQAHLTDRARRELVQPRLSARRARVGRRWRRSELLRRHQLLLGAHAICSSPKRHGCKHLRLQTAAYSGPAASMEHKERPDCASTPSSSQKPRAPCAELQERRPMMHRLASEAKQSWPSPAAVQCHLGAASPSFVALGARRSPGDRPDFREHRTRRLVGVVGVESVERPYRRQRAETVQRAATLLRRWSTTCRRTTREWESSSSSATSGSIAPPATIAALTGHVGLRRQAAHHRRRSALGGCAAASKKRNQRREHGHSTRRVDDRGRLTDSTASAAAACSWPRRPP